MSAPPALPPPSSSAPVPTLSDDVIADLQRRLRKPRSADPNKELIVVAARLAAEPHLDPSVDTFWQDHGVKKGGTRTRILEYRDRIISKGLLAASQHATVQPVPHCTQPKRLSLPPL